MWLRTIATMGFMVLDAGIRQTHTPSPSSDGQSQASPHWGKAFTTESREDRRSAPTPHPPHDADPPEKVVAEPCSLGNFSKQSDKAHPPCREVSRGWGETGPVILPNGRIIHVEGHTSSVPS